MPNKEHSLTRYSATKVRGFNLKLKCCVGSCDEDSSYAGSLKRSIQASYKL